MHIRRSGRVNLSALKYFHLANADPVVNVRVLLVMAIFKLILLMDKALSTEAAQLLFIQWVIIFVHQVQDLQQIV